MKRKIYDKLLEWKSNTSNIKPLIVLGVRQSGKTYIIQQFCAKEYAKTTAVRMLKRYLLFILENK